jgi:hypothetical protein
MNCWPQAEVVEADQDRQCVHSIRLALRVLEASAIPNEFNLSLHDPYLTQIRPGQVRVTDSCSARNPLILNSAERRHLRRKVVELASEFSSVNRRVVGS